MNELFLLTVVFMSLVFGLIFGIPLGWHVAKSQMAESVWKEIRDRVISDLRNGESFHAVVFREDLSGDDDGGDNGGGDPEDSPHLFDQLTGRN